MVLKTIEGTLNSSIEGSPTFAYYGQAIVTVVEYPSLLNTRRVP